MEVFNTTSLSQSYIFGDLLEQETQGEPIFQEQEKGWGASGCPGPTHKSTSSHVFSMTSLNNKTLSLIIISQRAGWNRLLLLITNISNSVHNLGWGPRKWIQWSAKGNTSDTGLKTTVWEPLVKTKNSQSICKVNILSLAVQFRLEFLDINVLIMENII